MSTNVVTKALTFPDQSTYYGQVLEGHTLVPHGTFFTDDSWKHKCCALLLPIDHTPQPQSIR